ncbi:hypothetical protein BGX34_005588 [Mortierella sp. NVP85]|nr:hypothetical protein BGX34_005588 [Mortierella sp. NVP85]
MHGTFESNGKLYGLVPVEGGFKAPCGNVSKSERSLKDHVRKCSQCREGPPPPKKQKVALNVVPDVFPEINIVVPPSRVGQVFTKTFKGKKYHFASTGISDATDAEDDAEDDWPALVDRETHVLWDDTDQGIEGLFDSWDTPGLQQKWNLLTTDIIFSNPTGEIIKGLVTETYDRCHTRDYFSEQTKKKADSSLPNGTHRHQLVRVTTRPASHNNEAIVLGTEEMNAIFPLMVYHSKDGSKEVEIGQSAGVGLFRPCSSTAVYLSMASIKAAKEHKGIEFPDSLLPRLDQLRSIRTGFHHMSTYFSARVGHVGMMPPTIFTLGIGGHNTTDDQNMVSGLFRGIALDVWEKASSAVLKRETVGSLTVSGRFLDEVQKLLEFFGDQHELLIIGNEE